MKTRIFILGLTAFLVSPIALANDSGVYGGIAVGRSSIDFNSKDFNSPSPSDVREGTTAGKDTGYKLFVGYRFDRIWAIEGGYTRHGNFQFRSTNHNLHVTVFDYSTSSWSLAGKGVLLVSERVNLFAKLGLSVNSAKNEYWWDSAGFVPPLLPGTVISNPTLASLISPGSYSKTTLSPLLGVGVEYAAWKGVKLRLEYENYGKFGGETSMGRATLSTTSFGVSYGF
ncbi:MAG: outer membrane beta-barrel protein [Sulfuricellaceae bacterium]|nr:outer membrane beta-barrel protein [Sulfuricellaceae bacterium]